MFKLRRGSGAGRAGILATVVALLGLTSVTGASATLSSVSASASPSVSASTSVSLSAPAEGHTKCVPWPKPTSLGLKCTGTFGGNTAWDPWKWKSLPASEQPTVTISQAKDLTDQDVQVTWSNFTPTIGVNNYEANPSTDAQLYQVSLFECNGTSPDASDAFASDCYMAPLGSPLTRATQGPPNGQLADTLDGSVPPTTLLPPPGPGPLSPLANVVGLSPPPGFTNNPATWHGQADFHVEAPTPRTKGGFFNCGPSKPCSLVIDPNFGGTPTHVGNIGSNPYSDTDTSSCGIHNIGGFNAQTDGSGADAGTGDFIDAIGGNAGALPFAGTDTVNNGSGASLSLGGESAACWVADRIVIPLSFAPTSQNCPNTPPQFFAQGSPMLEAQMLQWQAGFCTGQAPVAMHTTFNSESAARTDFLAGGQSATARVDMALVTLPADQTSSSRKFTYAPLANSGTGIAYYLDDGTTGSRINQMVLNARLLAKLTTQSYTLEYNCTNPNVPSPPWNPNPQANELCDPAVIGNPFSLFDDPEFLQLNKQCQPFGLPANYACSNNHLDPASGGSYNDFQADNGGSVVNYMAFGSFLPTVPASNDDMTFDMTSWMAADPSTAEFLAGQADPDGMRVNRNYQNVPYPTQVFPLLDNGISIPNGLPACTNGDCSRDTVTQDVSMNASWNFQTDLPTIAGDLLTNQPTADSPFASCGIPTGCSNSLQFNPTTGLAPELGGARDLLSELDLGDIATYRFPAAALVNADGKAVAPTQASVEAAVSDMKTNPDGVTQSPDFSNKDPNAYPLSMVDYAMVPTCGLSSAEAKAIADFLTRAATTGQTPGEAPGDLAPGYYPLNAKQKAQTLKAAGQVQAQDCTSLPSDHKPHSSDTGGGGGTGPVPGNPAGTGGNQAGTGGNPAAAGLPGSSTVARELVAPAKLPRRSLAVAPSGSFGQGKPVAFGEKSPDSGLNGILLLLAIIAGLVLLVGAPAAWVLSATGRWPVLLGWLGPARSSAARLIGRGLRGA